MGPSVFVGSRGSLVAGAVFVVLLAAVARADVGARRIPNGLVAALIVAGLGAAATVLRQRVGVGGALGGLALGLALWLPFWVARVLGAGDVKLAAAVGAWLGPLGVIQASVLAALAGGVLALAVVARRRRLTHLAHATALWAGAVRRGELTRPLASNEAELLPYGVALAAGAALAGWLPAAWLPF